MTYVVHVPGNARRVMEAIHGAVFGSANGKIFDPDPASSSPDL